MYSGTTFRTKSGRLMGVHQRIDRVARRHITKHVPRGFSFPDIQEILHFEGLNGPDGVKRKSPGKDEPWHYIDPADPKDKILMGFINDHIFNLSAALREKNYQRAAFEAAWLSHTIVDGLTPAHHYPLEAKLEELRDGKSLETRNSARQKIVMPGKTRRHQLRNNWEFWGAKGVMTTHLAFELGVASSIASVRLEDSEPTSAEFERLREQGFEAIFREILNEIVSMGMYDDFSRLGWTHGLARETRKVLIPQIVKAVTLAWTQAVILADEKS